MHYCYFFNWSAALNTYCRFVLAISMASAFAGCSREELGNLVSGSKGKTAEVSAKAVEDVYKPNAIQKPAFDRTSPDRALKSWWKFMDWRQAEMTRRCVAVTAEVKQSKFLAEHNTAAAEIAQDDLLDYLTRDSATCEAQKIRREILEVKTESETRAIIFAKLYNIGDIQPGADPSELSRKRREQGNPYKYLMEKSESGWKISQVYESLGYDPKGNDWRAVAFKATPSYPAYLSGLE